MEKKSLEEIKKSYPHTINFNKIEKIITALNKENIIHFKGSKIISLVLNFGIFMISIVEDG
jgi:hypothetical protein